MGGRLFGRMARDMEVLRRALTGPALRGAEQQAARINELEAEVQQLRRSLRSRRETRA
jgi:hypothetical protein